MKVLADRYNFSEVEKRCLEAWEQANAFHPEYAIKQQNLSLDHATPFCMVIPPPNVTGSLHVGHALNQTIQDVIARSARKRGYNTLWLPGMDHAGIATQLRVEKYLQKQKLDRSKLGRDRFIEKIWEWKEQHGGKITQQQRLMGFSLDWTRERFTMDEALSDAVRKVFVQLYRDGLIYRGKRMVHWDPETLTVLSDLEVEHQENHQGELYNFAYPLEEGQGEIVVSTTRPETMLGDTAIAVHPQDERYRHLIGKFVVHPIVKRKFKVIADAILVDPKFGTGAVKVTPAHDFNDFEVGLRHNLECINIFDEKAHINENGGPFAGMERYDARKAMKKELLRLKLERGTQAHNISIGLSQRSGAVVEPTVSMQWFVKMAPLAAKAKAITGKEIQFIPKQWENTYTRWLDGIQDWCISRQIWWGHRIPAWYGPDGEIFVAESEKDALTLAKSHYKKTVPLRQETDVLDTWFSSALWPFSTLGWPKKTKDLTSYYPTSVLVTGFDIIFFWVARMVMFGLHFMGKAPFHKVYIHGLMRDEYGKKMSKTKGNVIDPVKVIQEYGTDAFRFFLMATLAEAKDSLYSEQRLRGYQNFANKIWNSSRFVLMNLPSNFSPLSPEELLQYSLEAEDYWILNRLNQSIKEMNSTLDNYKFHLSADCIYSFFWHEFCDWYIEWVKPRVFAKEEPNVQNVINDPTELSSTALAHQVLYHVLRHSLGLLHPFMPFITEELYSYLNEFSSQDATQKTKDRKNDPPQARHRQKKGSLLAVTPWPETLSLASTSKIKAKVKALGLLQEAASCVRLIRAQAKIAPDKKITVILRSSDKDLKEILQAKQTSLQRLIGASKVSLEASYRSSADDAMEAFSAGEVYVSLRESIDWKQEIGRLQNELMKLEGKIEASQVKLKKEQFIQNAPAFVVKKELSKLKSFSEKEQAIRAALQRLTQSKSL